MGLILSIIVGGAILFGYVMVERRINQRACGECGYRASIDAIGQDCPRCGYKLTPDQEY